MSETPTPPDERYHALDCLRGSAMLLGVVLHAGVSFVTVPVPFWAVRDAHPHPLVDVALFAVHDFRMQLFFVLAGFFGCLLYRKYGIAGTAAHRLKRVGVPLVLAVALVVPTIMGAFLWAELDTVRARGLEPGAPGPRAFAAEQLAAHPDASNAEIVWEQFASGRFLRFVQLAHLWFLYYLLIFYAAALALAPLARALEGGPALARFDSAFRWLCAARGRFVVLPVLAFAAMLPMESPVVDTPLAWVPELRVLAYYALFFAFGWALYRHRDLAPAFGAGWRAHLLVAHLLVLPLALLALGGWVETGKTNPEVQPLFRLAGFAAQAAYTWLLVAGLWGAFQHYFARPRAWVRYLADSAYWCYLVSITPVVVLQFAVKDWPLPGPLKWALVSAAALGLLLLSYEYLVRYTLVGALLNGPKQRPRGAPAK
jgi:glucan biosynthesis protein C